MKPSICLTFKVHQPVQLKLYRFFDIGKDSHYYDEFANRSLIRKSSLMSYIPMNKILLSMIKSSKGKLKVSFAISGMTLDMMDRYCPEAIDSFRELADTGCVEFICVPFFHSLAAIGNEFEFYHQISKEQKTIKEYFGQETVTLANTDMVYSDNIGEKVASYGFKAMITEGSRHILGWRSPNYIYSCAFNKKLKLFLRNPSLSDDISLRFSDRGWDQWPLTAEKYYEWVKKAESDQVLNICLNYKCFGEYNTAQSGIFDFAKSFLDIVLKDGKFNFATPGELAAQKAADVLEVQDPISCEDEERDLSKWLGNELQKDAFNKLYAMQEKLAIINLPQLWEDYGLLQASDNFYYMNTKLFTDGGAHHNASPYDTPYEAFINYMNVLADFAIRIENEMN